MTLSDGSSEWTFESDGGLTNRVNSRLRNRGTTVEDDGSDGTFFPSDGNLEG